MKGNYGSFEKKRILYYVCALITALFYGLGYAWSVIQTPFVEAMHGSAADITATVALVYTVCVLCSTMTPTVLGGIMKKFTEPQLALIGGIMFGVGWLTCGHIHTLPMLFFTYAILTGVGTGLVYPTIMGYVAKLFPEKGGTFTSIYAGIYGGSAMIWSPIIAVIIENGSLGKMSNIIGPVSLILLVVCALLLKSIPDGFIDYKRSQLSSAAANAKKAAPISTAVDRNRAQMIKTPIFYIAMITFACGLVSGMFVSSQASQVLQGVYALTALEAATFVSVNSFASLVGRIAFGTITDHTDKYVTLLTIPVLSFIGMGLLSLFTKSPGSHLPAALAMALVMFAYGGFSGTINPITVDLFGAKYITENFGIMYLNFGIAALIGPRVAVKVGAGSGNYPLAFLVGAIIAAVSFIAALIVRARVKANQKNA